MTKEQAACCIYEDITKLIDASFRGASMIYDQKYDSWKVYGRFIINFDFTFEDLQERMAQYGFITVLAGRRYKDTVTFIKNYK